LRTQTSPFNHHHKQYLATVIPNPSNSTMQADIQAALAGGGAAGFCGLLGR
jgi:hypothetical protein